MYNCNRCSCLFVKTECPSCKANYERCMCYGEKTCYYCKGINTISFATEPQILLPDYGGGYYKTYNSICITCKIEYDVSFYYSHSRCIHCHEQHKFKKQMRLTYGKDFFSKERIKFKPNLPVDYGYCSEKEPE